MVRRSGLSVQRTVRAANRHRLSVLFSDPEVPPPSKWLKARSPLEIPMIRGGRTFCGEDAVVYDEKGRSMDKKALLADLESMPAGYGGAIKVLHPHAIFAVMKFSKVHE
jgi:hypothetical protein